MTDPYSERIDRLIDRIVGHLADNPHAADTVDGVHDWWLSGISHAVSRSDVNRAIRVLQDRGVLECRVLADGTRIYARAHLAATKGDA